MSKFNPTVNTQKFSNQKKHTSYVLTDKEKLVHQILTSFFNEKKYYGDNSDIIVETVNAVMEEDPFFIAKLAAFVRKEFQMRSISHVLITMLAHHEKGKKYIRRCVKNCALRGDDITEVLSCYLSMYGKPIPNALKKGIGDVLNTFDEYTFSKYYGKRKQLNMKDVLCLTHPKPVNEKQSLLFKKVLENNLEKAYTWEREISTRGNKKEVWEELIESNKLGYMALLRNLRNILQLDVNNREKVLKHISDKSQVLKSKQMPFRYLSAYKEVKSFCDSEVLETLEKAVQVSVDNIPKLYGTTLIAIDVSGSMSYPLSARSKVRCAEVSKLLGMIANRICEKAYLYEFNTRIKKGDFARNENILKVASDAKCGGATDLSLPFEMAIDKNLWVDRIIIISDNECNYGCCYNRGEPVQKIVNRYRENVNKNAWVHAIDLMGYGSVQFMGDKVNLLSGWNEKVFEFISLVEAGKENLVERIDKYMEE